MNGGKPEDDSAASEQDERHAVAQEAAELRGIPREQMLRELEILEPKPINLQDPDPVYRALLEEEIAAKFEDDEKPR